MTKRELLYAIPTVLIVGIAWATCTALIHLPAAIAVLVGMILGAGALRLGIALHDRFEGYP